MKRISALILCLLMIFTTVSGVWAQTLTVTLTGKGNTLYDNTLSSLEERIALNGYAATSLDGSYEGMYSRDAAIQALALAANGNYSKSRSILDYLYQYHKLKDAKYFYTRIGEISAEYTDNNFAESLTNGLAFENYAQTEHSKLVASIGPDSHFACRFVATTDVLRAISIYLNGSYTEFTVTLAEKSETGGFNTIDFAVIKEEFTGIDWNTVNFSRNLNLSLGKEYYLIFNAQVPENEKLDIYGTVGDAENYYYNKTLYGDKWVKTTDLPALKVYNNEVTDYHYSSSFLDFYEGIGMKKQTVQQIPSNGEQIAEVILNIERTSANVTQPLLVSLYSDAELKNHIETVTIPAADIATYSNYTRILFSYLNSTVPENYYLCLTSESTDSFNYLWYGAGTVEKYETFSVNDGKKTNRYGELSYFFAKTNVSPLSNGSGIQTDASFFVLHAFAYWYLNNPDTSSKNEFAKKVWTTFSSYADQFLSDKYFSSSLNLLYNPQFEHIKRNYSCYDLVTNVFASQALYEMAQVAEDLDETDKAAKYKSFSEKIATGIHQNLVTELNGKKIYAEMILKQSGKLSTGFSFINLAPAAAEWYAVDQTVLTNTYDEYLKNGTIKIGEYNITDAEYILSTSTSSGYTLGKNVAWELMCVLINGDSKRATELLSFLDTYNENIYAEKWSASGTGKDIGNQEQCSWLVFALVKMFPSLSKYQLSETPDENLNVNINQGTEQLQTPEGPDTKVLIVGGVMLAALLAVIICIIAVAARRKSRMRAYAKAMAAKRHRERVMNGEFSIGEDLAQNEETFDGGFDISDSFNNEK